MNVWQLNLIKHLLLHSHTCILCFLIQRYVSSRLQQKKICGVIEATWSDNSWHSCNHARGICKTYNCTQSLTRQNFKIW